MARRAVGLSSQPEYPNLEALLEAEAGQPHNGYYLAARIVPPIAFTIGLAVFLPLSILISPLFYIGVGGFSALGAGFWFLFDYLDRLIPPTKKGIRKLAHQIWGRYAGFGNMVGVEPALSPLVGMTLDAAAAIYLKHTPAPGTQKRSTSDAYGRAHQALEMAMGRMLELAAAPNPRSQELEYDAGWAEPLLAEMRQMDVILTRLALHAAGGPMPADPLANLRDARSELAGIATAIEELEQRSSN